MSFTIFGFSVQVRTSFLVVTAIMGFYHAGDGQFNPGLAIEWVAVATFAVLVHELGHAFAFRRYGRQSTIELAGFGGLTRPAKGGEPLSAGRDAIVTFAGPGFGFLLALVVWGVQLLLSEIPGSGLNAGDAAFGEPFMAILFRDLMWVSAGWSVLNLIPMLPLDGGLLLRNLLSRRLGAQAEEPALIISMIIGGIAAYVAWRYDQTWSASLAIWLAVSNAQSLLMRRSFTNKARHFETLREGSQALERGDFAAAKKAAKQVLSENAHGDLEAAAIHIALIAQLGEGDPEGALAALDLLGKRHLDPRLFTMVVEAYLKKGDLANATSVAERQARQFGDESSMLLVKAAGVTPS